MIFSNDDHRLTMTCHSLRLGQLVYYILYRENVSTIYSIRSDSKLATKEQGSKRFLLT